MIRETELVKVMSGSIQDLKSFVSEKDLEEEELKKLLEDEKVAQNRKNAKKFLEDKIDEKRFSEDFSRASRELTDIQKSLDGLRGKHLDGEEFSYGEVELDQMEIVEIIEGSSEEFKHFVKDKDIAISQMEELLETEKKAKDRKNVKEFLKTRIQNKKLYRSIRDAKRHIKDIEDDFRSIEDESNYVTSLDEDIEPHKAITDQKNSEKIGEKEEEDQDKKEDLDKSGKDESDGQVEDNEEVIEDEVESLENDKEQVEEAEVSEESPLEKKRKILDEMDVELSDKELEEITVEALKELEDEKDRREQLLEKLDERGIDTEKLEESTTEDLEKIVKEIESKEAEEKAELEDEKSADKGSEEKKSKEEIEEEAEEDLEMLMGARHHKEKEVEKDSTMDKIEDIKKRFKQFMESPEEENTEDVREDKLISLLQHYKVIQSNKEASVKTAQVMKGYLEHRIGAKRELTYGELAKSLDETENENLEVLKNFYYRMSNEEYLENITVENIDEVIEASIRAVEELN